MKIAFSCTPSRLIPGESVKRTNKPQKGFVPKPSPMSTKLCLDHLLPDDNDIWIEGSYRSSTTGEAISFFRSFRTGKCCKVEPPTGAHCCISLDEIQFHGHAIQQVARRPVTKDDIRGMPPPKPNPEVLETVFLLRNEPRRRRWGRWL